MIGVMIDVVGKIGYQALFDEGSIIDAVDFAAANRFRVVEINGARVGFLPYIEPHLVTQIQKAHVVGIMRGANEVTSEVAQYLQILRHCLEGKGVTE